MCEIDNKNFGQEVVRYLIQNYKIPIVILIICVSAALFFGLSRPAVYQSELVFSVTLNRALPANAKHDSLQLMCKNIVSDSILQPIDLGSAGVDQEIFNRDLLSKDYRGQVIRAQNQRSLDMIKIYAHGQTPEDAQNICIGVYEHFKAFSYSFKHSGADTFYEEQELERKLNSARQVYDEYCTLNADKLSTINTNEYYQRKNELYTNVIKWETLYQDMLRDNVRNKYNQCYQMNIVSDATLPTGPIPSRTGFILGIGMISGLIICLMYGILMVRFNSK